MKRLAIIFLFLAVLGCQESQLPTRQSDSDTTLAKEKVEVTPKAKAMAAKEALFQRLSQRLMEVMGAEGPVAAIQVCSQEATEISKQVGEKQGVRIGRTALKLRNSQNQPPEWAKALMSEDAINPQFVTVDESTLGALLPIKLQPQCMLCHGPEDEIQEPIKQQLTKLYPNDAATGFKTGDLRGWFWVEVPTNDELAAM